MISLLVCYNLSFIDLVSWLREAWSWAADHYLLSPGNEVIVAPLFSVSVPAWWSGHFAGNPALYPILLTFLRLPQDKELTSIPCDSPLDLWYQHFLSSLSDHVAISEIRWMVLKILSPLWKREPGLLAFSDFLFVYFELKYIKNFMPTKKCIFGLIT